MEWLTTLPVNGVDQAVEVRGDDAGAPLLLVIHGGPGFAMIDLLHETMPELEDRFVTVNYDQRGAGLSYSPASTPTPSPSTSSSTTPTRSARPCSITSAPSPAGRST